MRSDQDGGTASVSFGPAGCLQRGRTFARRGLGLPGPLSPPGPRDRFGLGLASVTPAAATPIRLTALRGLLSGKRPGVPFASERRCQSIDAQTDEPQLSRQTSSRHPPSRVPVARGSAQRLTDPLDRHLTDALPL